MIITILYVLVNLFAVNGRHFNGGTIRWVPINPYMNASTTVPITIIQTYSWTSPPINCLTNVPVSSGRPNGNLSCIAVCSTDGGYSTNPISSSTDCISTSPTLSMMTSQRAVNVTLGAGAYFYLSYMASAWQPLNFPLQSGLQWSLTTFVDLRVRSDGFINTPPMASVSSPQYAIVNQTIQIPISVSDPNSGDDVRCRWAKYIPGINRRRRSSDETDKEYKFIEDHFVNLEMPHIRRKRDCSSCSSSYPQNCNCSCSGCIGTSCSGATCSHSSGCHTRTTTTSNAPTSGAPTSGATTPGATISTTTLETPGTLASTISYIVRQAIDECGGICFPNSLPNGTSLSNCTLNFTGLVPNTWYGVAIQVEDFIDSSSSTPMSSTPVQFLIYVMPQPNCSIPPQIVPLTDCNEVLVGLPKSFTLYAMTMCQPSIAHIADIVVVTGIPGMVIGNLSNSPSNSSLSYKNFTWTPQPDQIGLQELCVMAFTQENVQSAVYCFTFDVVTSLSLCIPTTTTTTSTTTSSTSATTSTSITTTSVTRTKSSANSINWLLITGISLLVLLLVLCLCCCFFCCCWLPAARRRRRKKRNSNKDECEDLPQRDTAVTQTLSKTFLSRLRRPSQKPYRIYRILYNSNSAKSYTAQPKINARTSSANNTREQSKNTRSPSVSDRKHSLRAEDAPDKRTAENHDTSTTNFTQSPKAKIHFVKTAFSLDRTTSKTIDSSMSRASAAGMPPSSKERAVQVTRISRSRIQPQSHQITDENLLNRSNPRQSLITTSGEAHIRPSHFENSWPNFSANRSRSLPSVAHNVDVKKVKRSIIKVHRARVSPNLDVSTKDHTNETQTHVTVVKLPRNHRQSS